MQQELEKRERYLFIDFKKKEQSKILVQWKRLCLGILGKGGIKHRILFLIEEDIKKLKEDIKDGS